MYKNTPLYDQMKHKIGVKRRWTDRRHQPHYKRGSKITNRNIRINKERERERERERRSSDMRDFLYFGTLMLFS